MIRRTAFTLALSMVPAAAMAEGTMPQMDFQNPLTTAQLLWMVVILVVLYLTLSRWGLPQIGKVLERREHQIARDLAAAHNAKAEADHAVLALNTMMRQARDKAQADIAKALVDAKAQALADAKLLNDKLDAQLEHSEKQIAKARATALAAIKPVAADVAATLIARLTGMTPDQALLAPEIETAFLARKLA